MPDEIPTTASVWCEVGPADFEGQCPICTGRLPLMKSGRLGTREDVPQFAVGGTVRTATCLDCNGRCSSAEADLVRWWAQEYPARFATHGLPGSRVGGDVLLRSSASGKLAVVVSGRPAEGVRDVFATATALNDEVIGTFTLPSERWMVALLKSAYLSACLHLGEVPRTPDGEYARTVIREGTFGARGAMVGVGNDAVPFRIFRSYETDQAEIRRIWVGVALLPWVGGDVPIFGIGLGTVAFVTWPLPDLREKAIALARHRLTP